MSDDQRLLSDYAASGSREVLEELIRRHLALVYSSALRQVKDAHLAEDVAQAVFMVLMQKASTIRDGRGLGGWLLTVTRYTALNALKHRSMHQRHERLEARPEGMQEAIVSDDLWEQISPHLDGELSRLKGADREAVVMRYLQDRSFAEIGGALGLSEEAARKRVARAVEKLRHRLERRGTVVTAGALAVMIASNAVKAAPSHLAAQTAAACAGAATPQCSLRAKGAIKMLAYTKPKIIGTVASAIVLGVGGAVVLKQAAAQQPAATAAVSAPVNPNAAPATAATKSADGAIVINLNDSAPMVLPGGVVVAAADEMPVGGGFGTTQVLILQGPEGGGRGGMGGAGSAMLGGPTPNGARRGN